MQIIKVISSRTKIKITTRLLVVNIHHQADHVGSVAVNIMIKNVQTKSNTTICR